MKPNRRCSAADASLPVSAMTAMTCREYAGVGASGQQRAEQGAADPAAGVAGGEVHRVLDRVPVGGLEPPQAGVGEPADRPARPGLGHQEGQVPRGQVVEPLPPGRSGRRYLLERRHGGRDVMREDRGDGFGIRRTAVRTTGCAAGNAIPPLGQSRVSRRAVTLRAGFPPGPQSRSYIRHRLALRCTLCSWSPRQPRSDWVRYESRPGRLAVVAASLADLKGSYRGHRRAAAVAVLEQPRSHLRPEQVVHAPVDVRSRPGEPSRPEDLTTYLDGDTLIALWPDLYLPKGVRQAWEDRHPILRAAAVTAA